MQTETHVSVPLIPFLQACLSINPCFPRSLLSYLSPYFPLLSKSSSIAAFEGLPSSLNNWSAFITDLKIFPHWKCWLWFYEGGWDFYCLSWMRRSLKPAQAVTCDSSSDISVLNSWTLWKAGTAELCGRVGAISGLWSVVYTEHHIPKPCILDKKNDTFGFSMVPACLECDYSVYDY